MHVSVVVPTYNRDPEGVDLLRTTVEAVREQTYDDYDVVVVDDGSGHHQREYLSDLQDRAPEVTVVFQENSGPAAARNRGWRVAAGEVVAFTDDDCRPPRDWLERLVAGYEHHPDVGGVGGYIGPPTAVAASNVFARYHSFVNETVYEMPENAPVVGGADVPVGGTGNMSYTREALVETGGFDESFPTAAGEDADLQERVAAAGYRLVLLPLEVDHVQAYGPSQFFEENVRRGRGLYHFDRKHGGTRSPARIALGALGAPVVGLRRVKDTADPRLLLLSGVAHALGRVGELQAWWADRRDDP